MKVCMLLYRKLWILLLLIVALLGCDPNLSDDPIPYTAFPEIYINLALQVTLKTDGSYIYNNEGGYRGLIIYRKNASSYLVYERNCSFHPNEACATVDVDVSGLFMRDPCCSSSFSFTDGTPIGGPAWRPLRRYVTILEGTDLYITDEIATQ